MAAEGLGEWLSQNGCEGGRASARALICAGFLRRMGSRGRSPSHTGSFATVSFREARQRRWTETPLDGRERLPQTRKRRWENGKADHLRGGAVRCAERAELAEEGLGGRRADRMNRTHRILRITKPKRIRSLSCPSCWSCLCLPRGVGTGVRQLGAGSSSPANQGSGAASTALCRALGP